MKRRLQSRVLPEGEGTQRPHTHGSHTKLSQLPWFQSWPISSRGPNKQPWHSDSLTTAMCGMELLSARQSKDAAESHPHSRLVDGDVGTDQSQRGLQGTEPNAEKGRKAQCRGRKGKVP